MKMGNILLNDFELLSCRSDAPLRLRLISTKNVNGASTLNYPSHTQQAQEQKNGSAV
jgi:hypothetical protein